MLRKLPLWVTSYGPLLMIAVGLALLCTVLFNGLPGVDPNPNRKARYAPLVAAGAGLILSGIAFNLPQVNQRLAAAAGVRPGEREHFQSQRLFLRLKQLLFYFGYLTVFLAFVVAKMLILNLDRERVYSDTDTYVTVAEASLVDPAFWGGKRPFTLPLIYQILNIHTHNYTIRSEMVRVGAFQTWLSILSWAALGLTVACMQKTRWLRLAAFGLLVVYSLSLDISQWDRLLLSESVSISLFALLVAFWIWGTVVWENYTRVNPRVSRLFVLVFITIMVLYSFTRDTNAYVLLSYAVIMAVGLSIRVVRKHPGVVLYLGVMGSIFLIFILQNTSANIGKRWSPLFNIIYHRVLPVPESLDFFKLRGMPVDAAIGFQENDLEAFSDALYSQPSMEPLLRWAEGRGRATYFAFLLSRPVRSLREPLTNYRQLVNGDSQEYRFSINKTPGWVTVLTRFLYPRSLGVLLPAAGLVSFITVIAGWKGLLRPWWVVPVSLVVVIYPMMFVVWHGDAIEVERHATQIGIQLRLAGWIMAILLADILLNFLIRGWKTISALG